ncbi:MAG: aldo/keto reductase [Hyphomicrobiales bacterium]|nr:aldo/keto reductase [Hyphomicrobiales bacterium]MBV8823448.1 aldo/keto reductase [Hyphomicrobiales bacterium]
MSRFSGAVRDATAREELVKGRATVSGTRRYASRHPTEFVTFRELRLSRVGLGTSLGSDDAGGQRYRGVAQMALIGGINVIDTAISYGAQTCERAIGAALRNSIRNGSAARDEIFVVSKCGYLPRAPRGRGANRRFDPRIDQQQLGLKPGDILLGSHCIAPAFIADQIARSRRNLGLATIDLYLLHNPEVHTASLSKYQFERRMSAAFDALEQACASGHIGQFGISTWEAFRCTNDAPAHLSLHRLRSIAADVGGRENHFAAVQAPYNVMWREIATLRSQRGRNGRATLLAAAHAEDMLVLTSATLAGGSLAMPGVLSGGSDKALTDAEKAIAFASRAPGITCALVGMGSRSHLTDALRAVRRRRTAATQ